MVIAGRMTIGTLVGIHNLSNHFCIFAIMEVVYVYDQYQGAMAALERMFDLIDTGVVSGEAGRDSLQSSENKCNKIQVEFRNVTFGYDRNIPIIKIYHSPLVRIGSWP